MGLRNGRRVAAVAAGAAATALAATSLAWACTPPAPGSQTILVDKTSGPRGTTFTAKAKGAPVPSKGYLLKFADSMAVSAEPIDACPHSATIGGPTQATATGKIPPTTGVIPMTAALGNGQVCFALKIDNMRWTAPAIFNVTII